MNEQEINAKQYNISDSIWIH